MKFVYLTCCCLAVNLSLRADTVTLNSGEVITGEIRSETETQVEIETSNAKRTVFQTKQISKSAVRAVVHETAEQKRARADYEKLAQYQLNPNQELTPAQFSAGLSAFQSFLKVHPASAFAPELSHRIVAWQTEVSNVASGRVKFAGQWMSPVEKNSRQRQAQVQAIQTLQNKLEQLQDQRRPIVDSLAIAQENLATNQTKLASLQDEQIPIYGSASIGLETRFDLHGKLISATPVQAKREITGYQIIPHPARDQLASRVVLAQAQVTQLQGNLKILDATIRDVQTRLQTAQQALASQSAAVQTQNIKPAPVVSSPVAYTIIPETLRNPKHWEWIGGLGLVGLAALIFFLRRAKRRD